METMLGALIGIVVVASILIALFEYRIRQPDVFILYESKGQISIRKGLIYPRHFSLPIKRTTHPLRLTIEATASGNLGVRIQLVGSAAASETHLQALIRVGGWDPAAVERAIGEVDIFLQGLVKEYAERSEIHSLASSGLLNHLNANIDLIQDKFGLQLISLAIQSIEPTDPEISEALRQQEQSRILEKTEKLNQQVRVAAAKAKFQADEEIEALEHALELKKAELKQVQLEKESQLAQQRVEDELARSRLRLAFEKEELQVIGSNPELLLLTPQAARLAEASQSLKNARTIISLTPQELASGSELYNLFQDLIHKALESKKNSE
jgi:hypothetical protein